MITITVVSQARCKDCKFIQSKTFGKVRRNICTNEQSERHGTSPYLSRVGLRDLVCDKWELI